jgi:small subunit ribosomal protein S14
LLWLWVERAVPEKIDFLRKKLHPLAPSSFCQTDFYLMAKTCWIEREKRKTATVAKYAELRAKLKKEGDYVGLSLLPRNASPVRVSKRCAASGRKRGLIGRFKLSRIAFRELASAGLIPGVTKSSW